MRLKFLPRRLRAVILVVSIALCSTTTASADPASESSDGLYIVMLRDAPVATKLGSPQTTPPARLDIASEAARSYRAELTSAQDRVLRRAAVDSVAVVKRYQTTLNAVAVRLTQAEAQRLRTSPEVLSVAANQTFKIDSTNVPEYLGLTGRDGVWQRQYGGAKHAGEGIIIGVIDSGVWPESHSFAALPEPRPDRATIKAKWHGSCQAGTDSRPDALVACNNKLIGARWFADGRLRGSRLDEFDSPRDFHGHGTHTASIAAGNAGVPTTVFGRGYGPASGVAPAARIAAYKALWTMENGDAIGTSIDIVSAIEAAVDDGVDVISYSVSGITYTTNYAVAMAFFGAAQAGVFVAAAAGNSGDLGPGQVNHNLPWVTTVGATADDRSYRASLLLGDGSSVEGLGAGNAVAKTTLVDASKAGKPGADPQKLRLCFDEGLLDPAVVAGKIVLCARGTNPRTAKSLAVRTAGGAGMVLYNPDPASDGLNLDYHSVPTVHISAKDAPAVLAYANSGAATASMSAGRLAPVPAPSVATFSSYGPASAGRGDLLKPDIAAPGANIIAAVSPVGHNGEKFAALNGTSMSAPHIAGVAALIRQKHPRWSPMAIKSALMSTARTTDATGGSIKRAGVAASPLHYGAGEVRPGPALDPGLVYDSDSDDWRAYMCSIGDLSPRACDGVPVIDPSDLNGPSIAIGDLTGVQTVRRTVTNVTRRAAVYDVSVLAPPGTTASVSPQRFVVLPGRTATLRLTIDQGSAPTGVFTFGQLTLRGRVATVTTPIAVRPVGIAVPAGIDGAGATGTATAVGRSGSAGTVRVSTTGLVPSQVHAVELSDPTRIPFDQRFPAETSHTKIVPVTVPAGTRALGLGLFDEDLPAGTNADYHVYRRGSDANGNPIRTYLGGTVRTDSQELIELYSPAAGQYDIYVDLYSLPDGMTKQTIKFHSWIVGTDGIAVGVDPPEHTVVPGSRMPIGLSWSSLEAERRYFGVVMFRSGETLIARSVLRIKT